MSMTATKAAPAKATRPPTIAEQQRAILAAAAERQRTLDAGWDRFVAAVESEPGDVLAAYLDYRRASLAAAAEHPAYLPTPPQPRGPGDSRPLHEEYQHLSAWAPAIRAGAVEGTAANPGGRHITPDEREDFERRAADYRQRLAEHEQRLLDYMIWHRLLTPEERDELGPDGGYRQRMTDYEDRAQEYLDRTGSPICPGPRLPNQYGFAAPNNSAGVLTGLTASPVPPLVLRGAEGFDAALSLALAGE